MSAILIKGGTIVNEGHSFGGDLEIEDDRISNIYKANQHTRNIYDEIIDATGCFVLPGVIDEHVHFREPGLTDKADIESESRTAAYGGVTSYLEMPNTVPTTTSQEALNAKWALAKEKSHINYGFFVGATNHNVAIFSTLDRHLIPGIKLFMGASTGNMLVDKAAVLDEIFVSAAALGLPVMTHCEDTQIINENMKAYKALYGDDPAIIYHDKIRSREACIASSKLAIKLALQHHTRLHIAHITTKEELDMLPKDNRLITLEAVIPHLIFSEEDYLLKKALIKCNPAVKTIADRDALRKALSDGRIAAVGTDHAPHLLSQKQGGCAKAASGMPMIQFSLVAMLELMDAGILSMERITELMAHNPARLFSINGRGFIRKGYKADIAIVRKTDGWTVSEDIIQSKCKWSPLQGHTFQWKVEHTFCNGHHLLNKGILSPSYRGEQLTFRG